MKKDPSLKSQASAIFIGSLVGTLFQFLIPAVIVRLISQEDFGIFRQFGLVAGTFTGLLGMGYRSSLFYFYPTTDTIGKQKIIQQTQFLFLVNVIIFAIVFYFFGSEILIALNFKEFLDVKLLVVLFTSFMIFSSVVESIFTLEKNTLLNKVYPSAEKIVRFVVFVTIVLIFPGYEGPIYALVLYSLLRVIYYLIHIAPYLKKIYHINLKLIKEQLIYSLPFGFALILNLIATTFDKFFINQYITPGEFGIYSIAFLSIPILKQFFNSIHSVVVPEISILVKNNDINQASKLWQKTVEKTSAVTIPAVVLFWILANEIITILYTVEYIEAANYYRIFILMFFVSMFSHEIILRGANKTKYILYSNIVSTVLTVVLGFLIIPKMGLYGAIITALIGTITPMLISLHIERKIMNLSVVDWVDWKKLGLNLILCLMIGVPLLLLKDYVSNIFIRTFLVVTVFGLGTLLLQIKFDLFIFTKYLPMIKKYLRI